MRKAKGFTLLEMIIVLAIFSIIMYSVVQLLDPVSKFFVRSSNFENTTACIDNMRRVIEGNLKYADRVRAYSGYWPYEAGDSKQLTNELQERVKVFYDDYFLNRKFLGIKGKIYVLAVDNRESTVNLAGLTQLSQYNSQELNSGKISIYTFNFDNTDPNLDSASEVIAKYDPNTDANLWAVNRKLYGAFDYRFTLGSSFSGAIMTNYNNDIQSMIASMEAIGTNGTIITEPDVVHWTAPTFPHPGTAAPGPAVTTAPPATLAPGVTTSSGTTPPISYFDPQDFNIKITCREIKRKHVDGGYELYRSSDVTNQTASFAMKNVLNAADDYRTAAMDYKTMCNEDETDDHQYFVTQVPRYSNLVSTDAAGSFDGFYFIFTLPDDIVDAPDLTGFDERLYNKQKNLKTTTTTTS